MGKILITGASGFIGSHLVKQLLDDSVNFKKLRLFIPKGESLENLPNKNFDIVWADIREKNAVKKAVENVDVIYHLAARIGFDGK
ncbi:MAG TPA: NAD-dependent epimerase/dehydratase family protein, partial [Verrucomicrobiae bacterium]|nr:NAD-dependent epimerase/dehydratase family protein [Verrucomicrobiae bacterium]